MNTKRIIPTCLFALAIAGAPISLSAQTPVEPASPTRSGDGGVQTSKVPDSEHPKSSGDAEKPVTDPPKYSPTNTQTGGAVDTGTPKDNVDKNSEVKSE